MHKGKRLGFEFKFTEAPRLTASMRTAMADLRLDQLWVVYPGQHRFPRDQGVNAIPLSQMALRGL